MYAFSDGLLLPFAHIYPAELIERNFLPGWTAFGKDNYFSHFLCHDHQVPAIGSWDHEGGAEVEGVFDNALDWLNNELKEFVDSDVSEDSLHIRSVPDDAAKPVVISTLKSIVGIPSRELLARIADGPFTVDNVSRRDAFRTIRRLHAQGVDCYVQCQN